MYLLENISVFLNFLVRYSLYRSVLYYFMLGILDVHSPVPVGILCSYLIYFILVYVLYIFPPPQPSVFANCTPHVLLAKVVIGTRMELWSLRIADPPKKPRFCRRN